MKFILPAVVFCALPFCAMAQQAPVQDPQAAIYSQLLAEANSRVAVSGAQIQELQRQVTDLRNQLAATKAQPPQEPTKTP